MRAKAEIEPLKKGDRQQIVITEIPYQVNKAKLQERIADLVRDKVIEGISDIRDESDRDGMRVVIELKRGEVGEVVLNNLYKHTQLQQTFGIIMLAIVGGRPRVLTLLEVIEEFIQFRREVVRRRIEFELRKAEARAHILDGLRIALDQSRCRDHADSLGEESAGSQGRSDHAVRPERHPVAGHSGHAAPAADRPRAAEDSRRAGRAGEADRQPARHPRAARRCVLDIVVKELRDVQTRFGDDRRTDDSRSRAAS